MNLFLFVPIYKKVKSTVLKISASQAVACDPQEAHVTNCGGCKKFGKSKIFSTLNNIKYRIYNKNKEKIDSFQSIIKLLLFFLVGLCIPKKCFIVLIFIIINKCLICISVLYNYIPGGRVEISRAETWKKV